jgi:vitamin B12 transporter
VEQGNIVNIRSLSIGAVITALIPFSTIAAETENEIIVTATREPVPMREVLPATSLITRADIDRIQPRDLPSLLGRLSGVDFRDSGGRGSASGVFIRGAAPGQSIILIDGIRSASATLGTTALEGIPLDSIERIELVKGPVSGLYGADAVGGVIQIFTKRGKKQRLTPQVHASYRTDDTQIYSAELSAGNDRGGFHGTFSFENSAAIDSTTIQTGNNFDRDGYDQLALNVSANYRLLDTLEARATILRTDSHNEFDDAFGAGVNFDSDSKIENSTLNLVYKPNDQVRVSLNGGHFVDESITPVFGSDITTRRNTVNLQSDYSVNSDHTVTLGLDYYNDRVDTLSAFVEDSRRNVAGFFQWQGRYGDLSLVGSVRHDDNEAYGNDTNGNIALEYALMGNLSAGFSFGTAFRAPSFNDLYFPNFGNPNLSPEESESFEINLKGQHYGADWRLSAYHTDVDDLIGFDLVTFMAQNTAQATLKGIEFEVAYSYLDWQFTANMNYLDATDDTTNEYLDDRAKFAANFEAYRNFGKLNVSVDLQAESGRHDRNGLSLNGFAILGLGAGYTFNHQLRFSARLDNLWDEEYVQNLVTATESYRTYGRTALISMHLQY